MRSGSPRIPMAEEEVLKTFQCRFESDRGYDGSDGDGRGQRLPRTQPTGPVTNRVSSVAGDIQRRSQRALAPGIDTQP